MSEFWVQTHEAGCLDYSSFFSPSPRKAIGSKFTIYSTVVTVRTTGFIINRTFHFAHSLYLCVLHDSQNQKGLFFFAADYNDVTLLLVLFRDLIVLTITSTSFRFFYCHNFPPHSFQFVLHKTLCTACYIIYLKRRR